MGPDDGVEFSKEETVDGGMVVPRGKVGLGMASWDRECDDCVE